MFLAVRVANPCLTVYYLSLIRYLPTFVWDPGDRTNEQGFWVSGGCSRLGRRIVRFLSNNSWEVEVRPLVVCLPCFKPDEGTSANFILFRLVASASCPWVAFPKVCTDAHTL
jgi:hypothetical protein